MDIEEIISRGIRIAQNKPREIVFLYEVLPDRSVIRSLFSNLTEASDPTVSLCSVNKRFKTIRITIFK